MSKQRPQSPLTGSLLAAYEEHRKTPTEKKAEKQKEEEMRKIASLKVLLAPHRITAERFQKEQERLAYNFLIRFQNKIFDLDDMEYQEVLTIDHNENEVRARVLLWRIRKSAKAVFDAIKDTKGFRGFIIWVHQMNRSEKMWLAKSILDELTWVLRYGKDEADVRSDWEREARERQNEDAPQFAHSLTTPLGSLNRRTQRSLDNSKNKRVQKRAQKGGGGKTQKELVKLERLMNSDAVQRDLVKRDHFQFTLQRMSLKTRRRHVKNIKSRSDSL